VALIKPDTPAPQYRRAAANCGACEEALAWIDREIAAGAETMSDLFDAFRDLPPRVKHSWASWNFRVGGEYFGSNVRKRFLRALDDPMTCLKVYLKVPWLTDSEDAILEACFTGKLPRAERELAEGVVVRAKDSA
jgi:hypothetical protein